MKGSYDAYYRLIREFCNEFAENYDRVKKIKSLGLKREKDAFAMPEEMLDLVAAYIDERVLLFGEHAEKLTTK